VADLDESLEGEQQKTGRQKHSFPNFSLKIGHRSFNQPIFSIPFQARFCPANYQSFLA